MDRLYDEITATLDPFQRACLDAGLPVPKKEYGFHHQREWRADYAFPDPDYMLLVEVEGGAWKYGRHNRAAGFLADMEKYSQAAVCGYRVIRVTPDQLCTPETVAMVREALYSK